MAEGHEEEEQVIQPRKERLDLYACLNVPRHASQDEIRAAYLRVASALHPDKQRSGQLRTDAEQQFLVIDRAYKVLSEPLLRQTYDTHGERGLRLLQSVPPHEIIPVRYPLEVSYILNELLHEETSFTAVSALGSSGTVTLQCDVPRPLGRAPVVQQLVVDHQVEVPLTSATTLFGGVYMANRKAVSFGMGYIGSRVRLTKHTWASGTCVLGFKRKFTVETGHELSRATSARASLSVGEGGQAGVKFATTHHLSALLTGDVDVGVGANEDGMNAGLTMVRGKGELAGRLRLSMSDVSVRCTYQHRFTNMLHGKFTGKLGLRGVEVFLVGMRNLNNITGINLGLIIQPSGISITFKARRGRVNLYVPIQIARGIDPWSILVGSLVQAAVNAGIVSILRPFERLRVQRELRAMERQMAERQAQARRNAAAQVRLMLAPSERKRAAEVSVDGLVVLSARYGLKSSVKPPDPEWFASSKDQDGELDTAGSLDVTVPLQFFVRDSRLSLPAGSKAGILGFYDVASNPAWLFDKPPPPSNANSQEGGQEPFPPSISRKPRSEYPSLYVRYSFKGHVYEVTVDDLRPLDLPAPEGEATCLGPVTRVAGSDSSAEEDKGSERAPPSCV